MTARDGFCPDVLIVDFDLGQQLNGADVAEQIWRFLTYVPPTIMLTGNASGANLPHMIDVMFWLTCRPLNPRLMLAALSCLVQLSRSLRRDRVWSAGHRRITHRAI
jgi:hypothetical protein